MKTALLLITHGSPRSEGDDSAVRNRIRLKEALDMDVYIGYIHLEPSIRDAACRMLEDGVERIIAVPLFVFPGFLTDVTVRKEFGFEPNASGGVFRNRDRSAEVVFTGTFGNHPLIKNIFSDICKDNGASPGDTSVMLIFHGSRNNAGTEYVDRCADYLTDAGFTTEVAYNEFQHPTVEEATESLVSKGLNVLAIPFFVSPGVHTTSDIPPKLGLDGSRERDIGNGRTLRYVPEIGMHPGIAEILKARIDEVL